MKYFLIILFLSALVFSLDGPSYTQILNSEGYSGLRVRDDSLDIDTSGSGAWKSVATDTSKPIWTAKYESNIFVYTLAKAQSDSSSFKIDVGCYDGGVAAWLYGTDYTENQPYGADSMVTSYTLDTNSTGYGRRELQIKRCDSLRFVFSAPDEMSNTDTATVGVRYLRGQE